MEKRVVALLTLLLVISLLFLASCSGGGGVVTTAKGFLKAIDRGNTEKAKRYIAFDADFRPPGEKDSILKQLKDVTTDLKGKFGNFAIQRVDFCTKKDLDTRGNSECWNWLFPPIYRNREGKLYDSVRVVFQREGRDMSDFVDLVKIDGKWKVAYWNVFYIRPTRW